MLTRIYSVSLCVTLSFPCNKCLVFKFLYQGQSEPVCCPTLETLDLAPASPVLAWSTHILTRACINGWTMFYCSGLNENVPHRLTHLNTWILVGGNVWGEI